MSKVIEALDKVEEKRLRLKELSQDQKDKKVRDEGERHVPADAESKKMEAESDPMEKLQSPIQISAGPDLLSRDEEKPHPFTWWKIILGGGAFVVAIGAVFFYYSDRVPPWGTIFQVGTNKIDEESSNKPSFWKAKPSDAPPDPTPPAPPPELLTKHPLPTSITKSGPAEKAVAGKKEDASESLPSQPSKAHGYAIQVSAMRNLSLARAFVETKKNRGQQVYLVRVNERNGGVWYRVYVGRFADKAQAARYLEEKKIKDSFPESFIQKLP
jgi:septal ring-binding cell division protein DamX